MLNKSLTLDHCTYHIYRHTYMQAVVCVFCCSLKRIRRRAGKTVGAVSQEFVSIMVSDEFDREMEIITPWQGAQYKSQLYSFQ